ncbi:GlcNAc-PI de-N-acetylase [Brevibacillus reuszeri]|uniref:GlcNAc-PI de-N-acetylase n=1 Tax=Brevibacillus reuszeri TaxID=54915 RepID=A0ABQ0TN84_9BACL|nr:NEW3 domain-containing protein [Brevibacillus reuszeri]MED1859121.1 NEW3 domain-containing protein [Brevibacillus reuszeri]GED69340.1 GlcNAc-PI de-N-acetylase [Brevibacillus reuszeri]
MESSESIDKHVSGVAPTRLPCPPIPVFARTGHGEYGLLDLWTAIKPLATIASAMNAGAHPDDEHSAMLAYLAMGRGVYTSSIIATRGEGGQNEIGCEQGIALGIIRTRELEEASRMSNVTLGILSEELIDPIHDFGFSKCAEETFRKWGEEVVYERLVRKIRELRPDVVIACFENEPTTHGHHRAMTLLTQRAFQGAADPDLFPQHQESGLLPWQIKKLYVPVLDNDDYHVAVPIGEYDQNYGSSYVQLGERSRFMHKTQGMGVHYDEGPTYNYYRLDATVVPAQEKERDFFSGLPLTFADLAEDVAQRGAAELAEALHRLHDAALDVLAAYPRFAEVASRVHRMKALLHAVQQEVHTAVLDNTTKIDLMYRLGIKEAQLNRASAEALSFVVKIKPETGEWVAGQTTTVTVTAYNGGAIEIEHVQLRLRVPRGWTAKPLTPTTFPRLPYNQTVCTVYEVSVPTDARLFHPYKPPALEVEAQYFAFDTASTLRVEPETCVAVLPPYSLALTPDQVVFNTLHTNETIPVKVTLKQYRTGATTAKVSLQLPDGWTAEPSSVDVPFSFRGETKTISFTVKTTQKVKNGKYRILAQVMGTDGVTEPGRHVQVIEYPHVGRSYLILPTELVVQAFDLAIPENQRIGYVSSGFDNIDKYLRQVGVNCINLDADEIQSGDLSRYDTIILGIRAYGFRRELIDSNQRLLQYVENGGNLVVQYHKPEDKWKPQLAPYPIFIGESLIDWRVTNEASDVRMLAPEHPMFHQPNLITSADWDGWVQERSIYNPSRWGSEYAELIATSDPGEPEFRGIFLTAHHGKGTYTYSSLAWFREIPQLVPGAFRLFVNMISQKQ